VNGAPPVKPSIKIQMAYCLAKTSVKLSICI